MILVITAYIEKTQLTWFLLVFSGYFFVDYFLMIIFELISICAISCAIPKVGIILKWSAWMSCPNPHNV